MSDIIVFMGAVGFSITLDPSVWVFDERKIDLSKYSGEEDDQAKSEKEYVKGTSAQWDKELREGSSPPSERRSLVEERKVLEGDYAMKLAPFIQNAQPVQEATHIRIHRETGDPVTVTIDEAKRAILQFAKDGKPIRLGGPVHFYLPEMWKAKEQPIDAITAFEFLVEKEFAIE